ncbi:hypothetical protein PCYB_132830 [Plasmodium cynomolgi strain B]|uniref:Autophagy protein 5 n=1 Tax=Plasmodium cynomolgi (strain B) TaxID=1120755 RepID=K6UXC8_PLACD|nr:hypothetical protein PCYB_132830 [Plasmodium cynomolgi strain B]GAB68409.1 hypothetical protein PCYB_132830 [Plasmodium cynomolgi strain B]
MQKGSGGAPLLERPNVNEINKNIEASGLVLCLTLSEKDSPSLVSPSSYLLHVHRYMYLSNIVPKCERIILDWRLPIGVLFDIYCDVEGEDWSLPSLEEKQASWKRCSSGELFPDHVSVLEITPSGVSGLPGDSPINLHADLPVNLHADLPVNLHADLPVDLHGKAEREQIEGGKPSSKAPLNDATKGSLTGEKKPCGEDEDKSDGKRNKKNAEESHVKYYHMRMNKQINNDWYDQQFLSIADRNVPWRLVVHFKDEENYNTHFGRGGGGSKLNYDGNVNLLPYNSCIPLYRGFHDFEECLIGQLKKANYVFNKNNRVLQMLPQQVENELLQNLKRFDVESVCALYREHIDYNMVRFVDYFNAKCAQAEQNGHTGPISGEHNSVCALMKDENVVKDVPIIIHIYGPPYNQVLTKCPLFKIKPAEGTENTVDGFFAYTLGDFLHEQFPSFFRKIKKHATEGGVAMVADNLHGHRTNGEINAQGHLPPDSAAAEAVSATVAAVPSAPPHGEIIFYFVEDDYLIFSPYMFIIINGIQIPLKTPLYWLAANFSQFDNFLHVILRVPPY